MYDGATNFILLAIDYSSSTPRVQKHILDPRFNKQPQNCPVYHLGARFSILNAAYLFTLPKQRPHFNVSIHGFQVTMMSPALQPACSAKPFFPRLRITAPRDHRLDLNEKGYSNTRADKMVGCDGTPSLPTSPLMLFENNRYYDVITSSPWHHQYKSSSNISKP